MSKTKLMTATALFGLVLNACAAQVEGDEEVGDVGQVVPTTEALNHAFDFQVGIRGIRYNSKGQVYGTPEAWTAPLSKFSALGSGISDSPWTAALVDPAWFRIGIKALGGAGSGPVYTDFRLRIQERNSVTGVESGVAETMWISEFSGLNTNVGSTYTTFEPFIMFNEQGWNQFRIGLETRWWPAGRSTSDFHDMMLSADACSADVEATYAQGDPQPTKWLSALAPGEVSWSHTVAPTDGAPIAYFDLAVTAK